MINPKDITKFDRTNAELQEFLLFCVVVAGKKSSIQAEKLETFLSNAVWNIKGAKESPFELIRRSVKWGTLMQKLVDCKIGQYKRVKKTFTEAAYIGETQDIEGWGLDILETFLGPKTARFFLLHSRPNQEVAVLDTHILKYMRLEMGVDAPKSTPTGKRYRKLEQQLITHIKGLGENIADFDLRVWTKYSEKK
jgi:thermostable 8-oxoguanine DNA glycosylase